MALFIVSLLACGKNSVDLPNIPNIPDIPGDVNEATYGSLSVSGSDVDSGSIQSTFYGETLGVVDTGNPIVAIWGDGRIDTGGFIASYTSAVFDAVTGDVSSISYGHESSNGGQWVYILDCSMSPECVNTVSVNLVNKSVTFSNTALPLDSAQTVNQATESISINGSLSYITIGN